ncbi:hypothetical protein niasHT_000001 [Heterodera trifolii]|uniref:Uncharacterized protein n=1 Tax=Heterodera trifolii TaxID=157864 RepID=A0ABD2KZA9_9BILA
MGVAQDFGLLVLNAREFRRAGLNPRVWLARRVNQSAIRLRRRGPSLFHGPSLFTAADPSPPFRRPSARTPSLPRTPSFHRRGALSDGADPLSLLPRTPPHHSVVRRRGPSLFHGPSLFTAADPSPPFCRPSARTLSLPRTLSLYCRGFEVNRTRGARVLLRESRGCARGRGVGKTSLKMVPEAKFFRRSA